MASAEDYVHAFMWSFPPTMIYAVLANFLAALGRAHVIMVVAILAVGLNMVVNYTLVFGNFGFPALGVAGAGYGSIIVSFFTLACLSGYVRWSTAIEDYPIFPGLQRPEPRCGATSCVTVCRSPASRWPRAACSRSSPS